MAFNIVNKHCWTRDEPRLTILHYSTVGLNYDGLSQRIFKSSWIKTSFENFFCFTGRIQYAYHLQFINQSTYIL